MGEWEGPGRSDEWFTPTYIFDAMHVVFDLDVATCLGGSRNVPCKSSICKNSLESEWFGFVWMNPPFGPRNAIRPWLQKFIEHGHGVALTPDRTSAPWWQWAAEHMDRILFVSPKIKFERADGSIGAWPGSGTTLMAIGPQGIQALENARSLGFLMRGGMLPAKL